MAVVTRENPHLRLTGTGSDRAYHGQMYVTRLFLTALVLGGCGVADFDISQSTPEQTIPGSGLPGPLAALFQLPLNLDLSSQIKQMDTGPIDSVTLSSISLTITTTDEPSGDTDDWSFVQEVHVFVSGTNGSSLPRVEIAKIVSPGAVQTMNFDVDGGVNLKPYVDQGSVVDSTGSGTQPPDDVSYEGSATFTVHPL